MYQLYAFTSFNELVLYKQLLLLYVNTAELLLKI